jgi:hypothetical protein
LECAEGIPLHLAADRISEKFTANLSSGKVESTLDEIFLTGQAIIFKVIEVKSASGFRYSHKSQNFDIKIFRSKAE